MNKYAVLIGNSQFPDESDKSKLPDLACPVWDVDGLHKVLASERGEFDVLALKNKPHYEILDKLQDVVNQAKQEDLLLIYYSGHGKPNRAGVLHLTTFDTVVNKLESRAIPINRVYDILGMGKARKIVIILDCCYSGAAGQGFKGAVDDQLQQLNNARGTYLVTASTELQVAHESAEEGLSLFTKHLIAGLETGEADKDGDGWVSMNELYDYVQSHVVAENPAQQPTKHVKEERGGLFIAKSGRKSRPERAEKIESYFYELAKEKRIARDILTEVLRIIETPVKELSAIDKEKDNLISAVFEKKDTVAFVRNWDKFEIAPQPNKKYSSSKIIFLILLIIGVSSFFFWKYLSKQSEIAAIEKQKQLAIEFENKQKLAIEAEKQNQLIIEKKTEAKEQADGWHSMNQYQVKEGLVKDIKTGLMWMRCSLGQKWNGRTCEGKISEYTWERAMEAQNDFKYSGYSAWRLPTVEELNTLVYCSSGSFKIWNKNNSEEEHGCTGNYSRPTILTEVFPETAPRQYWSSTASTVLDGSIWAWYVYFYNGKVFNFEKGYDFAVRLVRTEGESSPDE